MKKLVSLLLAVLMCVSLLVGCGSENGAQDAGASNANASANTSEGAAAGGQDDAAATDVSDQTYVWCSYYSTDDFMKRVWRGFEAAGEMLGVETVHMGDTGDDLTKYLTNVENAINMDPAGIGVMCFDAAAYVDVINKAMDSGIPVITTAPDSPESKRISFIGLDNYSCGEYAAQMIGEACGGEGEVMLMFRAGVQSCQDRMNGFKDYLAAHYPNMSVTSEVNVTLELTDQTTKAAAALSANPNIKAAYGTLGLHANAIYQAAEELGMEGLQILGMDTDLAQLELAKDGEILGTLKQGTFNQGFWCCLGLYLIHNGFISAEEFPSFINCGVTLVDESNAAEEIDLYMEING